MALSIEDMATFCKKKGFVYPCSEIYGGMSGFFDFGPLGADLKNNIKREWWKTFIQSRDDVVGIDGAIISHPMVWKASGHTDCFSDILIECTKCKQKTRADHFVEDATKQSAEGMSADDLWKIVQDEGLKCPKCKGEFSKPTKFNLMFHTNVGPVDNEASIAYLRPETAQLIFTDFKLVAENSRMKLPFGIGQVGKAFRNEISPRDFLFRSREFEQMEIEFFTHPEKTDDCPYLKEVEGMKLNVLTTECQEEKKDHKQMTIKQLVSEKRANAWHAYWLGSFVKWFTDLGIKGENLRLREHMKDELAHYAGACFDIEYKFPFGWKEIHGNADRGQYDLMQHAKFSKKDMSIFIEETKEKVVPAVASEPSQGVDRAFLAFMFDAYTDDKERGNVVLRLHPKLAPIKAAIFPLVNKLDSEAKEVHNALKKEFPCMFDRSGSVGRRYARADEIGVPYCITFDFDSREDKKVTIRNIQDTKQARVAIAELPGIIERLIYQKIQFSDLG